MINDLSLMLAPYTFNLCGLAALEIAFIIAAAIVGWKTFGRVSCVSLTIVTLLVSLAFVGRKKISEDAFSLRQTDPAAAIQLLLQKGMTSTLQEMGDVFIYDQKDDWAHKAYVAQAGMPWGNADALITAVHQLAKKGKIERAQKLLEIAYPKK